MKFVLSREDILYAVYVFLRTKGMITGNEEGALRIQVYIDRDGTASITAEIE